MQWESNVNEVADTFQCESTYSFTFDIALIRLFYSVVLQYFRVSVQKDEMYVMNVLKVLTRVK